VSASPLRVADPSHVTASVHDGHRSDIWLRAALRSHGRTCTLVLCGALCTSSIAILEVQVDHLGCLPCDDAVVDVRGLKTIVTVGANVLLGLYHYIQGRGGRLRFTGATDQIALVLRHRVAESVEGDALSRHMTGGRPTSTSHPSGGRPTPV